MIHSFTTSTRFPLGQIVATANAVQTLSPDTIALALARHASGDWGELCDADKQLNDEALDDEGRLFSAYGSGKERFWIITECDRSVTTVLLPEDY